MNDNTDVSLQLCIYQPLSPEILLIEHKFDPNMIVDGG